MSRLPFPLAVLTLALPVHADEQLSAGAALQLLDAGDAAQVIEMRGKEGQPQPVHWNILTYDRQSPVYLRALEIRSGRVDDEGESHAFYPSRLPDGRFDLMRLRIDSPVAFEILGLQAGKAGIGFDSVDYLLYCRPFDSEPVWRLTAVDRSGRLAGIVDLSGESGSVLRTVWYRWPVRDRGFPEIIDSAMNGEPPVPVAPPAPAVPPSVPPPMPSNLPQQPAASKAVVAPADPGSPFESDPVKVIPLPPANPNPLPGADPKP